MNVDIDYRPGLDDLRPLVPGSASSATSTESVLEARRNPRTTSAATLAERTGYDDGFLDFDMPLPTPMGERANDILEVGGDAAGRLNYTHFTVVMSRTRRMAMFVAVNIDGSESVKIERGKDQWALDGRIPAEAQAGEELYADNLLDRGHLVRREDPNWGADAATANEDTFHFTNCAPQMAAFNQKTWLSLEDHVLQNTRRWRERVTVFSGPVFRDDDRSYRGVRIPAAFWKVVAFVLEEGRPSATAYIIEQAASCPTSRRRSDRSEPISAASSTSKP
jgi:endonuclease G